MVRQMIISYAYQWGEVFSHKRFHSDFPSIILYRNWLFHVKLTKGNISDKLKEIYRQFSIPESKQNTSDRIAELVSTKKLREELKNVFKSIQCDFPVLDSLKLWKQFMGCIITELLNKPLEIKNIIDILSDLYVSGKYSLPKRLILVNKGKQILYESQLENITIDAKGESSDPTPSEIKVCGIFPLDENRENFFKD